MNDREELSKVTKLYNFMYVFFLIKIRGMDLKQYFYGHGYQNVAIYGMAHLGEILLEELLKEGIDVKYVIDKNADGLFCKIDTCKPDDDLKSVDVVIVTPITYFEEIKRNLRGKVDCDIVSIEDMVKEML